jgi:hypothetical protein
VEASIFTSRQSCTRGTPKRAASRGRQISTDRRAGHQENTGVDCQTQFCQRFQIKLRLKPGQQGIIDDVCAIGPECHRYTCGGIRPSPIRPQATPTQDRPRADGLRNDLAGDRG